MTGSVAVLHFVFENGTFSLTIDKLYENKAAQAVGIGREFAGHVDVRSGCAEIREGKIEACVSSLVRFRDALDKCLRSGGGTAEYESYYDDQLRLRVALGEDGHGQVCAEYLLQPEGEDRLVITWKTDAAELAGTLDVLNAGLDALNS
jgi:hypothetical protein